MDLRWPFLWATVVMQQSIPTSIAGTPDLAKLLLHVLLKVAHAPASGGGAIVYIDLLRAGLAYLAQRSGSPAISDWHKEATNLRAQLAAQRNSRLAAPTAHDLRIPLWERLQQCVNAHNRTARLNAPVSALLALGTLHAVNSRVPVSLAFVQGIQSLYKSAAKRKAHSDWYTISSADILTKNSLELVLPTLINSSAQKFVVHALAILESPAVSVASVNLYPAPQERSFENQVGPSDAVTSTTESKPVPAIPSDRTEQQDSADEGGDDDLVRWFQPGDSIVRWHATRASFAHRNERLALLSWESLPVELTKQISRALSDILSSTATARKPAAALALLSLLTSTPLHVLLHAGLRAGTDFYINLGQGCLIWSVTDLLKIKAAQAVESLDHTEMAGGRYFRIALPEVVVQFLRFLKSSTEAPASVHELFQVAPDSAAWHALVADVVQLLRQLGDRAYPANPGRWANSIARVYLETVTSDLMAAACSCSFELTPISAFHYFHPDAREINKACADVFQQLGLGPIAAQESSEVVKGIARDDELKLGFLNMEREMRAHLKCIRSRTTTDKRLTSFNALVELSAASFVFLTGSRGSKIDEIRVGSVYLSDEIVHLDDKDVVDERGSRLVPKSAFLSHVLSRLGHAQILVGRLVAESLPKNQGDKWRELARGEFRFDAIAFQRIECVRGRYCGKPLLAEDVERIAQGYFGQRKNFMRHVLITRWSTARLDRSLLRLITGHSTSGLQVPALGAVYSPKSAIMAARHPLEQLLGQWVVPLDAAEVVDFKPQFPELPGRRIHKNHRAHRLDLLQGVAGPRFDRWHLAAYEITTGVRNFLLSGHAPINPWAALWLHLLVFDGLHEADDLALIFLDLEHSLALGESGWIFKLRRKGNRDAHLNAVQAPTAVLLHTLSPLLKVNSPGTYASILSDVTDWLRTAHPKAWAYSKARGEESSSRADVLMASVRLWCDLCVPTALQYSYESTSNAAILDSHSASRILGVPGDLPDPVLPETNTDRRSFQVNEQLENIFRLVRDIGDNSKQLGELRERARLMKDGLQALGVLAPNTWPDLLARCIRQNINQVFDGDRSRLEFSSLSTYVSYLKPNFKMLAAEMPGDFDEIDWLEASHSLRGVDHTDEQSSPLRKEAQHDAVNWLLRTLREDGVSIPDGALSNTGLRAMVPITSHPIVHVEDEHLTHVRNVLEQWFRETPIRALRADLALELLASDPLRWGELSCLSSRDLVHLLPLVCIQPSGFSQIKSHLSKRLLPMSTRAITLAGTLLARLAQAQQSVGHREFLFLDQVDGDVDRASLYWLHSAITEVLHAFAATPNVRVHTLRARFISEAVFPGWRSLLRAWLCGSTGPVQLDRFFQYSANAAWRIDESRCLAGHGQDRTTLGFYVYPSFQVRALAMAATLAGQRPATALVASISTVAAFKKQVRRVEAVRSDPWLFIQRHVPRIRRHISAPVQFVNASRDDVTVDEQRVLQITTTDIQYVALRLAGCSPTEAIDRTRFRASREDFLEELISAELDGAKSLRQRVRGDTSGRAAAADTRTLVADTGQMFAALALKSGRAWNEALLALLTQTPTILPWHQLLLAIESGFGKTPWAVESICDIRYEDVTVSVKLNQLANLVASAPQRAVGRYPRVFVCLKQPNHQNTVIKARLTVMARLICRAYLLLSQ